MNRPHTKAFLPLLGAEIEQEADLVDELKLGLGLGSLVAILDRLLSIVVTAEGGVLTGELYKSLRPVLPSPERLGTLLTRAGADMLASMKSPEDKYASCCRSALCHAAEGSFGDALGALRIAATADDTWARHHHIYGLIHALNGDIQRARFELGLALAREPFLAAANRIRDAIRELSG